MVDVIAGSAVISPLGDREETFDALIAGKSALRPLAFYDRDQVNVHLGYQIGDGSEGDLRPAAWLVDVIVDAVADAGLDLSAGRVAVVVGTSMRELRGVERALATSVRPLGFDLADLHFTRAVRSVVPDAVEIITVTNACSAGGHALAIGEDYLASGLADAVIVAACDGTSESMIASIGRVHEQPSDGVRPFDRLRKGVLLGEGAAALVLLAGAHVSAGSAAARVLGTEMACDAAHETAPDPSGIARTMRGAHRRAGITPADVDLVIAHGTGTALNDPTEAAVLVDVFTGHEPVVTALKGALGHTTGPSPLMSIAVGIQALQEHRIPAIVGLTDPIDEAADLDLVVGDPRPTRGTVVQVDAFGFGGVNAVTLLEVLS